MPEMKRLPSLEERICDDLLKTIGSGALDAQGRLPSEAELAKEYGVSRATVRSAMAMLVAQGIIVKKHGSGTFINPAMLQLRIDVRDQWEFEDLIRSSGFKPGIQFIDTAFQDADEEIASALEVSEGDEILVVRKVFTASERPAIYSINMLATSLAKPPHDMQKLQGPIFPYLKQAYGLEPTYSAADIFPVVSDEELSRHLQIDLGSPVLLMKDVFFHDDALPIMYAHNYYSDILHFKAIRQQAACWI